MSPLRDRLAVVILTYNRAQELRRTLSHMLALREQPEIVVVDNASTDETPAMVRRDFHQVRLIRLDENIGAAARNIGVQQLRAPYVAFCDDDTWWAPGALTMAADLLDAYPEVAACSARVLVGDTEKEDPACRMMADSPVLANGLPGPALIGFLAGACVMRRQAFMEAGGYEARFFIGAEEALLGLDLVASGWRLVYAPQLTVHHYPSAIRDTPGRRVLLIRNELWLSWMRLPLPEALRETQRIFRCTSDRKVLQAALFGALRGLPWVLRKRKAVSEDIALLYRMVHSGTPGAGVMPRPVPKPEAAPRRY